jgi:hypothetical protein
MGAPSGARLLADLMTGARLEINPFAPDRFDNQTAPARVESVVL